MTTAIAWAAALVAQIPGPGTSLFHGCGQKGGKKKKEEEEAKQNLKLSSSIRIVTVSKGPLLPLLTSCTTLGDWHNFSKSQFTYL